MARAWRKVETRKLVRLRAQGLSAGAIASRISRNRNQVLGKTFRLRRAGLIVDTQLGMGFAVLGRHVDPQSLQDIVRQANHSAQQTGATRAAAFREAWQAARDRAGLRIPDLPRSVGSYVASCGGIRPSRHTKGVAICYLNRAGLPASEMAYSAADNGYRTDACEHTLIDMLADETAGARHYSDHDLDVLLTIEDYATDGTNLDE